MRALLAVALAVLAPGAVPPAGADNPVLDAVVGPGFSIALRNADGTTGAQLPAGDYTIRVDDRSAIHDFHLAGPGIDRRTGVASGGTVRWKLTLRAGTYRYWCVAHAATMRGSFTVG